MRSLNILIVEDQSDLAANLWDYFSRRGHTSTTPPTARPACGWR
ncbi:hypothetical protein [Arenimonas daejeonensis]|nr:hypothetical protein [Arenimonas daejeonensis]